MKAYFKQLFEYDRWANDLLLSRFEKQFPQNVRIYELFSHILSAQKIWLDRSLGLQQTAILWIERLPEEMREDLEMYNLSWINFIDNLPETDFDKEVTYTNSKGDTFTNSLMGIIAHVINHSTYHRGNLIILMKEEGFVLPNTDLIAFLRK